MSHLPPKRVWRYESLIGRSLSTIYKGFVGCFGRLAGGQRVDDVRVLLGRRVRVGGMDRMCDDGGRRCRDGGLLRGGPWWGNLCFCPSDIQGVARRCASCIRHDVSWQG